MYCHLVALKTKRESYKVYENLVRNGNVIKNGAKFKFNPKPSRNQGNHNDIAICTE